MKKFPINLDKTEQFGLMVGLHKKNAFEGWFSKIDDKESGLMVSVIFGYSTGVESRHAFIQFQDNVSHSTAYVSYPIDQMKWNQELCEIRIGPNKLSKQGMSVDIKTKELSVEGAFTFGALTRIRKSFLKPNIMGWLTYFPNECNHSIISMRHEVNGTLKIGQQMRTIHNACGYIEKDWGSGFPKEYVWVQANEWQNSSIVFSYATVPMLGKHAKGFFLVLRHEGVEQRFSSIEGSKIIRFHVTETAFEASVKKGNYLVNIQAKQTNPVALVSPVQGEMSSRIKESLAGKINVTLYERGRFVVDLFSKRASIDIHYPDVDYITL